MSNLLKYFAFGVFEKIWRVHEIYLENLEETLTFVHEMIGHLVITNMKF